MVNNIIFNNYKMEIESIFISQEDIELGYKICLKNTRNLLLAETDKYMMIDFPLTSEQLLIAKEYRQALRDITINNYQLPNKPDFIITMN